VDGDGAVYVTGDTESSDFPATPGDFDTTFNDNSDAFVVKAGDAEILDFSPSCLPDCF